jgi:hypothetical protein
MDYTEADLDYIHISNAIREVNYMTSELSMELLGLIKKYNKTYPSHYKKTFLMMKFLNKLDKQERLETINI